MISAAPIARAVYGALRRLLGRAPGWTVKSGSWFPFTWYARRADQALERWSRSSSGKRLDRRVTLRFHSSPPPVSPSIVETFSPVHRKMYERLHSERRLAFLTGKHLVRLAMSQSVGGIVTARTNLVETTTSRVTENHILVIVSQPRADWFGCDR